MKNRTTLIASGSYGQLGNRLFLFAHLVAHAIENNRRVVNTSFNEYSQYFPAFERDLYCRYPLHSSDERPTDQARKRLFDAAFLGTETLAKHKKYVPIIGVIDLDWPQICHLNSKLFARYCHNHPLLFVRGYRFRDYPAVTKHSAMLRQVFRPLKRIERNVSALVSKARESSDVLVGLHIRQGDYKTFMGGRWFYTADQYAGIMKKIEMLFPGRQVTFIICSNAPQDSSAFQRFRFLFGTGHLVEDMYALAQCDYIIGAPSSYTRWASFYGDNLLYQINDPYAEFTAQDFQLHGGNPDFDMPGDMLVVNEDSIVITCRTGLWTGQ